MSTHYGRMIHEDDRTIMFANRGGRGRVHRLRPGRPLGAADQAAPPRSPPRARGGPAATATDHATVTRQEVSGPGRNTMYEKDGENTSRTAHALLERARTTGPRRPSSRQRMDQLLPRLPGVGPPETHWTSSICQKYSEDDLMKDVLRGRPRRPRHLPAH